MVNLPETIIKRIKNILYNAKSIEDRNTRHKNIQGALLELFKGLNCYTVREYPIEYDRKYRSKTRFGEPHKKKYGFLDIYAERKDFKIVIEFDNGASLKWISIEKLLQSDALCCFGMTYGPRNKIALSRYYEKNLKRIQQVYRELISNYDEKKEFERLYHLIKKDFWLGIMRLDVFEKVNFKELMKL